MGAAMQRPKTIPSPMSVESAMDGSKVNDA